MDVLSKEKLERIRSLNDSLRRTFTGGQVLLSSSVAALPMAEKAKVLAAIQGFTAFSEGNDPHGEHDFASVDVDGERYFAKIDYYDLDMRYGADDPADPAHTKRVMTIMCASEY